jgi:hypothetical protein
VRKKTPKTEEITLINTTSAEIIILAYGGEWEKIP